METTLGLFLDAIAASDTQAAIRVIAGDPGVSRATLAVGATRGTAGAHFVTGLARYAYAGDTALHFAAAAYNVDVIDRLLAEGAAPDARNRRGASPLHYAAVGDPQSPLWEPQAQAQAIGVLIAAGADVNARDKGGATPLHRAVRTRCAAAVQALLAGGADVELATKNGSTPAKLAVVSAGRGGSGSPEARAQQALIVRFLEAAAKDR